jgi:hypothetical protein
MYMTSGTSKPPGLLAGPPESLQPIKSVAELLPRNGLAISRCTYMGAILGSMWPLRNRGKEAHVSFDLRTNLTGSELLRLLDDACIRSSIDLPLSSRLSISPQSAVIVGR